MKFNIFGVLNGGTIGFTIGWFSFTYNGDTNTLPFAFVLIGANVLGLVVCGIEND